MIEKAALDPQVWPVFLAALASELGEPVIALNLEIPGRSPARLSFRVNSDPKYGEIFARWAARGELPWQLEEVSRDRFQSATDFIANDELCEHAFYAEYMKPQGLAPEGPRGLVFGVYEGRPTAAIGIYRREGGRSLGPEDLDLLDALVPSFGHAYQVHLLMGRERQQREAMAAALDHFSSGVVLLDERGRAVSMNREARRIAEQDDGFRLESGRPVASDRASAPALRELIARAVRPGSARDERDEPVALERPSGGRALVALATGLHTVPRVDYARDAVAALFVTDPDVEHEGLRNHLVSLYGLTPAEADIAALLCLGRSVERAACARGVTVNTARGQLKQIFAKTGTSRQPELVRLALTSYAGIRDSLEAAANGPGRSR